MLNKLTAMQVFTPGSYPTHTYVERNNRIYEDRLRDAIDTPGQVVSLSGPSKSGKTVLVENVVGRDNLIAITGSGINWAEEIWDRVLDWMDMPSETSRSDTFESNTKISGEGKGGVAFPALAKAEASLGGEVGIGGATTGTKTHRRRGLTQVVREIGNSDFVILIDDFHYMPREIQMEVAMQVKEAIRLGVKTIIASVPHRSDDVVRANPELRGRVMAIDLAYWNPQELLAIAEKGFDVLKGDINNIALESFVVESAGSPQLMQLICLNTCLEMGLRERPLSNHPLRINGSNLTSIYERTATTSDFRSLVDVLDAGPKTRGTERKMYSFTDSTQGDVYRCILKAVASDPPRSSFSYDDILQRVNAICKTENPTGSSIIGSCSQMAKLALEKFPKERVIDWDEQKFVFDIPDPYLIFYLRWSGRLLEVNE